MTNLSSDEESWKQFLKDKQVNTVKSLRNVYLELSNKLSPSDPGEAQDPIYEAVYKTLKVRAGAQETLKEWVDIHREGDVTLVLGKWEEEDEEATAMYVKRDEDLTKKDIEALKHAVKNGHTRATGDKTFTNVPKFVATNNPAVDAPVPNEHGLLAKMPSHLGYRKTALVVGKDDYLVQTAAVTFFLTKFDRSWNKDVMKKELKDRVLARIYMNSEGYCLRNEVML